MSYWKSIVKEKSINRVKSFFRRNLLKKSDPFFLSFHLPLPKRQRRSASESSGHIISHHNISEKQKQETFAPVSCFVVPLGSGRNFVCV
jgi:hypothetical protein